MHGPLSEFLSVQLSRAVWNKNTIVRLTKCTSHWTKFVGATESRGLKKKNGRTSDWMHEPLNKFCQCVLTCVTSSFRKNYIFYPPHYLFYCSISASLYLDRSEWHRSYVVSRKTTMIGTKMLVLDYLLLPTFLPLSQYPTRQSEQKFERVFEYFNSVPIDVLW